MNDAQCDLLRRAIERQTHETRLELAGIVQQFEQLCEATTSAARALERIASAFEAWNRLAPSRARLEQIEELAAKQAEDEVLWRFPETASEAYFQQELRRLHKAIESSTDR